MSVAVITWAQNASPIHQPFWASLQRYVALRNATLHVVAGRYRNATSVWSAEQESDDWWAPEVMPYLTTTKVKLSRDLIIHADVRVQPTAKRPLNGFEVYAGNASGIIGHPKRALKVVPRASRNPRVL